MAEGNISTFEGQISYFCTPCSKRYKKTKKLFVPVQSLDSCYICIRCGKAFDSGFSRNKMNSTEAVRYSWEESGMSEDNVPAVEEISYFCTPCSKRYKKTKRLFVPVQSLDSCYICIRCGKAFDSGFSRNKINSTEAVRYSWEESGVSEDNVPAVEEISYFCTPCSKRYKKTDLFVPVQSLDSCYICIRCGKAFDSGFSRNKINSTEAVRYSWEESGVSEDNVPAVEEIFYFCTPCSKSYKKKKRLFVPVQSLDSCYICIRCGKAFQSGFSMNKMSSTEAVNYRCDESDITFGSSTQLLHHSYRDSDDRLQRCSHCQKGSAKAFFLERHLKERLCYCLNCMEAFRGKMCPLLFSDYQTLLMCEKCSDGSLPITYVTLTGCSSVGKQMVKKILS